MVTAHPRGGLALPLTFPSRMHHLHEELKSACCWQVVSKPKGMWWGPLGMINFRMKPDYSFWSAAGLQPPHVKWGILEKRSVEHLSNKPVFVALARDAGWGGWGGAVWKAMRLCGNLIWVGQGSNVHALICVFVAGKDLPNSSYSESVR